MASRANTFINGYPRRTQHRADPLPATVSVPRVQVLFEGVEHDDPTADLPVAPDTVVEHLCRVGGSCAGYFWGGGNSGEVRPAFITLACDAMEPAQSGKWRNLENTETTPKIPSGLQHLHSHMSKLCPGRHLCTWTCADICEDHTRDKFHAHVLERNGPNVPQFGQFWECDSRARFECFGAAAALVMSNLWAESTSTRHL